MPTLITQDEFEPNVLPNPNLIMEIPALATLPVAQFLKKKLLERSTFGKVAPPSPKTKNNQVWGHNHGSEQVHSHLCKITTKPMETRKSPRPPIPRIRLESNTLCLSQWAR
jgi:hypothetical protein